MKLKDLITGAQEAMDQGDYRLAIAAGNHALAGYEGCLAAHRLLGEAYLEMGDQAAAVNHFDRTLEIDPLNVVARLGLGVAAEGSNRYEEAYGHYLYGWEINPGLDQVRDELVRLRGLLNIEDRLHPTRAGLAGIHARCGQFSRAAGEWRAILAVEPESRRARTSLAELLWRQGDDPGAAVAAREALAGCPENARALAILADVEKRHRGGQTDAFVQRYVGVDPTGDLLEYLQHWRSDTDLSFLVQEPALIDEFDFEGHRSRQTNGLTRKSITGALAANQIAAPDLWDTLVKDLATDGPDDAAPTLDPAVEPFSWPDNPLPDEAKSDAGNGNPLVGADENRFAPVVEGPGGNVQTTEDESPAPAEDLDYAQASAEPSPLGESGTGEKAGSEAVASANAASAADSMFNDIDADIVPFSLDELTGIVSPVRGEIDEAALGAAFGGLEPPAPVAEPAPIKETGAPPSATPAANEDYVDQFVTPDGRIDLTAGWDNLDSEIEAATPAFNGDVGVEALVAELEVDGVVPFDAAVESADEDAWSPFSEVDFEAPAAELTESSVANSDEPSIELALPDATGQTLEIADLQALDVEAAVEPEPAPALGKDILAGIPLPEPSGYTALLANVDEEPLPNLATQDHIDPFANPDASGSPLAFDELIEVTSTDGTGPLTISSLESDLASAPEFAGAASEAAEVEGELDAGFEGIEPFDLTAFMTDSAEVFGGFGEEPGPGAGAAELELTATDMPHLTQLESVSASPLDEEFAQDPDGAPVDFTDMDVVAEAAPVAWAPEVDGTGWDGPEFVAAGEEEAESLNPEAEAESLDAEAESVLAAELDGEAGTVEAVANPEEATLDEAPAEPMLAEFEAAGPVAGPLDSAGDAGGKVIWPQFVGQTSELIDRPLGGESLFSRIAAQKEALVEMGVVAAGKRLTGSRPAVSEPVIPLTESPAAVLTRPQNDLTEQLRSELMGLRVRLIEDEASAPQIAEMLEQAIIEGLQAPLALRVLGEAYLKMGQVERAAAQFRQAMQARRHGAQGNDS